MPKPTHWLGGLLFAGGLNFAHANLDGTASAKLGGASVTTTSEDILVLATGTNVGNAKGHGVTVGGIAVGGMETLVHIGTGAGTDEVVAALDASRPHQQRASSR
ncbi:hypothetical protein LP420_40265 [Massilia sp. B-10]|nr:hypothetical protein LP420_40265 [Massilia sp. B-10]